MKNKKIIDYLCVGDILFVGSQTIIGWTLKTGQKFTKARYKKSFDYSHVILSLGKGLFIESSKKKGVSILTSIDLLEKMDTSYYKDNYRVFRNEIISNSKEMKRKIFMSAEYYYGQTYNKCFYQKICDYPNFKREKHAYCSQLIYNIYNSALNLKLKPKKNSDDVFPIHIWDMLNDSADWKEVTNDLKFMLKNMKKYQEKYQLDFKKDQTFDILDKKIIINNNKDRENVFSIYDILLYHQNFILFLNGLSHRSNLPFSVNIEERETYYDMLFNVVSFEETLKSSHEEIKKIEIRSDISECVKKLNSLVPLDCYLLMIDENIKFIAEYYVQKLILDNTFDEEVRISFKDKPIGVKIQDIDRWIKFHIKNIYQEYNLVLQVNTNLDNFLYIFNSKYVVENMNELTFETENYIKKTAMVFIWDRNEPNKIVNEKHLNDYYEKCKNEKIRELINLRKQLLGMHIEIMAKIRILSEYIKINSRDHVFTLEESKEIYLTLKQTNKNDFLNLVDQLKVLKNRKKEAKK